MKLRFVNYDPDKTYIDVYTHEGHRIGHFKKIFGEKQYELSCVERGIKLEELEQILEKLRELNHERKETRSQV